MTVAAHGHPLDAAALAARTQRAVDAAITVARELGLSVRDGEVLHDAFSVVVRLSPAPVVARVPVVLPHGLDASALRGRQQRELALCAWLFERGHPVVRPSPLVASEPVARAGLSLTFWEWVEVDQTVVPNYYAAALHVPPLHAALREYPAQLPFLGPVAVIVPHGLAFLAQHPELLPAADLERAQREWIALAPLLSSQARFTAAFPSVQLQAVHGDAPAYNLLHTTAGIRYADFEDATLGPREWDLALFGEGAAAAYDAAAAAAGVRSLDRQVLKVMDAARNMQLIAAVALVPQLPLLAAGLAPSLEQWRASPFAGDLLPF